MKKHSVSIILNNIRSSHNVGSMFRTADALDINKIYLVGYTPAPKDKFNRENNEISKVALGGEKTVAWESVREIFPLISDLKKNGNQIVSVEQNEKAVDYKDFKIIQPTVFIFGNEVEGVEGDVLDESDKIIEIPMRGEKESLNVSVAFGIALARILDL